MSTAEGDIGELELTATSLTSKILNAESDISTLEQTANSLTSRISDAEGNISTIEQTASGITAAVNAAKLEFDSSGLTIKNGGFKILQGSTTIFSINNGLLYLRGEFRTGLITMKDDRLTFERSTQWVGVTAGAQLYMDGNYFTINNYTNISGVGHIRLRSYYSSLELASNIILDSNNGNINLNCGDLYINNEKIKKQTSSSVPESARILVVG
jgi:hypothetical protein